MRVALVHDWITVPGGSEEVLREAYRLYPGVVFTSQFDGARFPWLAEAEVRTSYVQRLPLSRKRHYLYAPLLSYVYPKFDLREFDLVLSDSHSFAHGVVKRPDALHVNYYHAPARSLWTPEIDNRAQGLVKARIARRLKVRDLAFSERPDVVFANSHTTAQRIERFYGRRVDAVIYPPVHTARFLAIPRRGEREGFLMWGRMIDYKRFDLAIEAARREGFRLNLVGSGPLRERLERQAAGAPNIVFHGRLSDAALDDLIAHSRAALFPCYEDFGIIPVEAMAAGLPVVAYGEGGAAETVTDGYGVQMARQTVEDLVGAIRAIEGQTFDPEALRRHAAEYDVEVFRRRYREAVEAALMIHSAAS